MISTQNSLEQFITEVFSSNNEFFSGYSKSLELGIEQRFFNAEF